MTNIVLIGMPGSGKSTLGRRAARELGMEFIDTDVLIEEHEERPITEIFRVDGEAYFRALETLVIETVLKTVAENKMGRGLILSVGGGAAENPENAVRLRAIGKVFFIDRPLEALERGIAYNGNRPLLSDREKLVELYERRTPIYAKASDKAITNASDLDAAADELVLTARLMGAADDFLVIGDPIAHTLSPRLHRALFGELMKKGVDIRSASYGAARVPPGRLEAAVRDIRAGDVRGLNVTIPHKKAIIPFLDEVRGDAAEAGAVNTVVWECDGLVGYNTDMEGLKLALAAHGRMYGDAKVAVCGTGGAAAGIVSKAVKEGAARVYIIGRNEEAAARMAGRSSDGRRVRFVRHDFEADSESSHFEEALADTDIFINATPLGMDGARRGFASFLFLEKLPGDAFVYDLVYSPRETALVRAARARGLGVDGGLSMLIYQGILSDELFFSAETDRGALYEAVRGEI